jgi:hypothetical protein
MAALTRRWWPVRRTDEARAAPGRQRAALPDGEGLLMMVNQFSGDPNYDPSRDIARVCPRAEILTVQRGREHRAQLEAALAAAATRSARDQGAGGDRRRRLGRRRGRGGASGTGCRWWWRRWARSTTSPATSGVYDLQEVDDATRAGQASPSTSGWWRSTRRAPARSPDRRVVRARTFLNTASIGSYPELVRLREHWQPRWGKWPAFVAALLVVLQPGAAGAGAVPRRVAHGVVPVRRQRALPPARHGSGVAADAGLGAARRAVDARRRPVLPAAGDRGADPRGRSGTARSTGSARCPSWTSSWRCPECWPPTARSSSTAAANTFRVAPGPA